MRSVIEWNDVLDVAEDLAEQRQFPDLVAYLARLPEDSLQTDLTLRYLQAFGTYMIGQDITARELVNSLLAEVGRGDNSRLTRRIMNLTAIVEVESGRLDNADALLSELYWLSDIANDLKYTGYATLNQGISMWMRGAAEDAISMFERASVAFQRRGDFPSLAGCNHNLGLSHRDLGHLPVADEHFAEAAEYYRSKRIYTELVTTDIERALLVAMRGDNVMAEKAADIALSAARQLHNDRLEGEALRVLGTVLSMDNRSSEAKPLLHAALQVAVNTAVPLLEAEVAAELAWVYRLEDFGNAQAFLDRGVDCYTSMGAPRRAAALRERWLKEIS